MTFKDFIKLDEIGQFGNIGMSSGHTDLIKMSKPVKNKGSTISRHFNAGKVINPSRPARIISPNKPMMKPSLLSH